MGEQTEAVIRLLHLSMAETAESVGVSYDTVKGWSYGRSDPTPENRRALAGFLRSHGIRLLEAADEVEAAGE